MNRTEWKGREGKRDAFFSRGVEDYEQKMMKDESDEGKWWMKIRYIKSKKVLRRDRQRSTQTDGYTHTHTHTHTGRWIDTYTQADR